MTLTTRNARPITLIAMDDPGMRNIVDHRLDAVDHIRTGRLPDALVPDGARLDALWELHPEAFHDIKMLGRVVKTPRWCAAYGQDYVFSGNTNRAQPVPPALEPLLAWAQQACDPRLNALLVNWYEAERRHYIGKHRDSTVNMIEGAPIVTVSFGATRVFRVRPHRGTGMQDLTVAHGDVVVIPYATNLRWTHEVPHFARDQGRRVSVTFRAFRVAESGGEP